MMVQDIQTKHGQLRMGFQRILAVLCFAVSAICLSWELPNLKDGSLPVFRDGAEDNGEEWAGYDARPSASFFFPGLAMAAVLAPANSPMHRAAVPLTDSDGFMGSNDEKPAPASDPGSGGAAAPAFNPELLNFLAPMFNQPLPYYDTGSGSEYVFP